MSIFRRALCLAAFAFSLCALADADYFYLGTDSGINLYSYGWGLTSHDFFYSVFPSIDPSWVVEDDGFIMCDGDGDTIPYIEVVPVDPSVDTWLFDCTYYPSNPAYSDFPVAPASDPLAGGGSPSGSGGGEGNVGFDPVGSFGGLPSFMSGLSSVALGLFGVASVACLSFLVYRKVRYSSKRV